MPDEAANIIYVLCTETSSYVNGAEIDINGGQHVRRHRTRARADAKGRYGDGGGLYL